MMASIIGLGRGSRAETFDLRQTLRAVYTRIAELDAGLVDGVIDETYEGLLFSLCDALLAESGVLCGS